MRLIWRRTLSLLILSVSLLLACAEKVVTSPSSARDGLVPDYICPMRCGKMKKDRTGRVSMTLVSLTNHTSKRQLAAALIVDGRSEIIASKAIHLSPLDTDEFNICALLAPEHAGATRGHVRILFGGANKGSAWVTINSQSAADKTGRSAPPDSSGRLGDPTFFPCTPVTETPEERSALLRYLYTHKGTRGAGNLTAETKDANAPGVCVCGLDEGCTCPPASGTGCVGRCPSSPASCEGETASLDLGSGFHINLCITLE